MYRAHRQNVIQEMEGNYATTDFNSGWAVTRVNRSLYFWRALAFGLIPCQDWASVLSFSPIYAPLRKYIYNIISHKNFYVCYLMTPTYLFKYDLGLF